MTSQVSLKSAVTQPSHLITGEELFMLGDIGRTELVQGEIIHMTPTGYVHGLIEGNLAAALNAFVRTHRRDRVLVGEVGIYTARNPDTVRAADVATISEARLARVTSSSFLDVAPELVVEILSPTDRRSELLTKIEEYFAAGVVQVWVVDPPERAVYVYHAEVDVVRYGDSDRLTGGSVLPGFEMPVAELFV